MPPSPHPLMHFLNAGLMASHRVSDSVHVFVCALWTASSQSWQLSLTDTVFVSSPSFLSSHVPVGFASPISHDHRHTPSHYQATFCIWSFLQQCLIFTSHFTLGLLSLLLYHKKVIMMGVYCINKLLAAAFLFVLYPPLCWFLLL